MSKVTRHQEETSKGGDGGQGLEGREAIITHLRLVLKKDTLFTALYLPSLL